MDPTAETTKAPLRRTSYARLRAARGLALACHPVPALAVTGLITLLAASSGRDLAGCLLVAVTVLSGQLFIGWTNDLLDRDRDIAVGRADKPLATGASTPRAVRGASLLALACCVPLSLANGWRSGVAHLVAVGSGWAYDVGLKSTIWSALPYAVCFGSLPAFVSYAGPQAAPPAAAVVAAGALLGVGAHLTNVLPDLAADEATGVRGLPHRLGSRASVVLAAAAFVAVVALVIAASPDPTWWPRLALAGVAAGLTVGVVVTGLAGSAWGKWPFRCALGIGAIAVLLLVLRGGVR